MQRRVQVVSRFTFRSLRVRCARTLQSVEVHRQIERQMSNINDHYLVTKIRLYFVRGSWCDPIDAKVSLRIVVLYIQQTRTENSRKGQNTSRQTHRVRQTTRVRHILVTRMSVLDRGLANDTFHSFNKLPVVPRDSGRDTAINFVS